MLLSSSFATRASIARVNVPLFSRKQSRDCKRLSQGKKLRLVKRYVIRWSGGPVKQYIPKTIDIYNTFKDLHIKPYCLKNSVTNEAVNTCEKPYKAQEKKVEANEVNDGGLEKVMAGIQFEGEKQSNEKSLSIERRQSLCKRCFPQIKINKYKDPPAWKVVLYEFFGWDLRKRGIGRSIIVSKKRDHVPPSEPPNIPAISSKVAFRCKAAQERFLQEEQESAKGVETNVKVSTSLESTKNSNCSQNVGEVRLGIICKVCKMSQDKSKEHTFLGIGEHPNSPTTCGGITNPGIGLSPDEISNVQATAKNEQQTKLAKENRCASSDTQTKHKPATKNGKICPWADDQTNVPPSGGSRAAFETVKRICGLSARPTQKKEDKKIKSEVPGGCKRPKVLSLNANRKFKPPPQPSADAIQTALRMPERYTCGAGALERKLKKKNKKQYEVKFKYRDHCTRKPGEEAPRDD